MGGVQLKYININKEEDDGHVMSRSDHVTYKNNELVVEDIDDSDMEALCSQSELPNQSIGGQSDQSRTAFENPFTIAQNENEIHFYNEGIDMTVFNKQDSVSGDQSQTDDENKDIQDKRTSLSEKNTVRKHHSALRSRHKDGSPQGQGQRSRLVGHTVDLLREASFVSGSSGYYSESQPGGEFSERNHPYRESFPSDVSERSHPYRESFTSDVSQRDFSAFITQPDRERISNRGLDMTMYMYVIGGKESKSQNVTIKPINMWKLQIY